MTFIELECLQNFHGDYAGLPGYDIYAALVRDAYVREHRGIFLAHDAGHPITENPVLVEGDIEPLAQRIRRGDWPFVLGAYGPEDFPGCTLSELENIGENDWGDGLVMGWGYEVRPFRAWMMGVVPE